MSKRRVKKKVWYRIVAEALETQKTFSITESKYGSRYIYEEIAHYLLDGCSETEKCKSFNYYCRKVKHGFKHAIVYLESEGIKVRRHGKANRLFYVTLDETFPNSKEEDFKRTEMRVKNIIEAAQKHIEVSLPRLESRFNKSSQPTYSIFSLLRNVRFTKTYGRGHQKGHLEHIPTPTTS